MVYWFIRFILIFGVKLLNMIKERQFWGISHFWTKPNMYVYIYIYIHTCIYTYIWIIQHISAGMFTLLLHRCILEAELNAVASRMLVVVPRCKTYRTILSSLMNGSFDGAARLAPTTACPLHFTCVKLMASTAAHTGRRVDCRPGVGLWVKTEGRSHVPSSFSRRLFQIYFRLFLEVLEQGSCRVPAQNDWLSCMTPQELEGKTTCADFWSCIKLTVHIGSFNNLIINWSIAPLSINECAFVPPFWNLLATSLTRKWKTHHQMDIARSFSHIYFHIIFTCFFSFFFSIYVFYIFQVLGSRVPPGSNDLGSAGSGCSELAAVCFVELCRAPSGIGIWWSSQLRVIPSGNLT